MEDMISIPSTSKRIHKSQYHTYKKTLEKRMNLLIKQKSI